MPAPSKESGGLGLFHALKEKKKEACASGVGTWAPERMHIRCSYEASRRAPACARGWGGGQTGVCPPAWTFPEWLLVRARLGAEALLGRPVACHCSEWTSPLFVRMPRVLQPGLANKDGNCLGSTPTTPERRGAPDTGLEKSKIRFLICLWLPFAGAPLGSCRASAAARHARLTPAD